MNVSGITYEEIATYIRLDSPTDEEISTLNNLLAVAKAFVSSYTGQTIDELDACEDVVIVIYVLCQDMWDNRTLYVDSGNLNKVVETILGMHSVNLL